LVVLPFVLPPLGKKMGLVLFLSLV